MCKYYKRTDIEDLSPVNQFPDEIFLCKEVYNNGVIVGYEAVDINANRYDISLSILYEYFLPKLRKCSLYIEEIFSMIEEIISTQPVKSCRKSVLEMLDMYTRDHPEDREYVMSRLRTLCDQYGKDFYIEIRKKGDSLTDAMIEASRQVALEVAKQIPNIK